LYERNFSTKELSSFKGNPWKKRLGVRKQGFSDGKQGNSFIVLPCAILIPKLDNRNQKVASLKFHVASKNEKLFLKLATCDLELNLLQTTEYISYQKNIPP